MIQNCMNLVFLPKTKFKELKTMGRYIPETTGNILPSAAIDPVGKGKYLEQQIMKYLHKFQIQILFQKLQISQM